MAMACDAHNGKQANRIRWLKLWNTTKTTGDDRTFVSDFNLHDDIAIAHNMYNTHTYIIYMYNIYIYCMCWHKERFPLQFQTWYKNDNWPEKKNRIPKDYPLAIKHGNGKSTNLWMIFPLKPPSIVDFPATCHYQRVSNHIILIEQLSIYIYVYIYIQSNHIHIINISYIYNIHAYCIHLTMIYRSIAVIATFELLQGFKNDQAAKPHPTRFRLQLLRFAVGTGNLTMLASQVKIESRTSNWKWIIKCSKSEALQSFLWAYYIYISIYRLCLCCFNWSACFKSWPSKSSSLFQTDQHLQWDQTWHPTLHHQYIGVPTYLSYNSSLHKLICVLAIGYIKWYWCYC